MDENEGIDLQEALRDHVGKLTGLMEQSDPQSEEYEVLFNAVTKLTEILMKIDETQNRYTNEEEQRKHEIEMEKLKQEAAREAREADERLKQLEHAETKRWHNIDMILRIASVVVSVATVGLFGFTAWTQTRMNYVDNVYDVNGASRMILQSIGKMINPTLK